MNWLAFWASVIGSLAWPAMIVIVLLIFKRELLAAAPWLRELEVGSVKVRFTEELAKAADAASEIEQRPAAAPSSAVTDADLTLAEYAPLGLVIQSWISVENALGDSATRHGLSSETPSSARRSTPSFRLIEELEGHHVITNATARTLRYLRQIRNQVVHHKGSIDTAQALEYARLTKKVLDALDDRPTPIAGIPSSAAQSLRL